MERLVEDRFPVRVQHCAARLAQQGTVALGELFDLTAARAVRFAKTITRNSHDAEDALQSAFVRIALHPQNLAEAWHPWAYLLQTVRNEALKIAQKRRINQLLPLEIEACRGAFSDASDSQQYVRAALDKLPASQSEVVVLKIWEGLTFGEIAAVLGESPNTAASRYRYALAKLTLLLRPLSDEDETVDDEAVDEVNDARSIVSR